MIHLYIQYAPIAITALRMKLSKQFGDSQTFMLLGAFDDRHDPYEVLSNRRLNADEIEFLETCIGIVSFVMTEDTKCSKCGVDMEHLLDSKHAPVCENCKNMRTWDVFLVQDESDNLPVGTVEAGSQSQAFERACVKYHTYDLVVKDRVAL